MNPYYALMKALSQRLSDLEFFKLVAERLHLEEDEAKLEVLEGLFGYGPEEVEAEAETEPPSNIIPMRR